MAIGGLHPLICWEQKDKLNIFRTTINVLSYKYNTIILCGIPLYGAKACMHLLSIILYCWPSMIPSSRERSRERDREQINEKYI